MAIFLENSENFINFTKNSNKFAEFLNFLGFTKIFGNFLVCYLVFKIVLIFLECSKKLRKNQNDSNAEKFYKIPGNVENFQNFLKK